MEKTNCSNSFLPRRPKRVDHAGGLAKEYSRNREDFTCFGLLMNRKYSLGCG